MFLYSIIATWYALPKHVYRTKIWLTLEEFEKNITTVPEMSLSVRALRSMSACSHTVVSIAPFFLRLLVADASAKIICHWKQRSLGITEPSVRGQHHPLPLCTILPWAARVRRTTLIQFTQKKKVSESSGCYSILVFAHTKLSAAFWCMLHRVRQQCRLHTAQTTTSDILFKN